MEQTQQRVRPESIAARNFSDDLDSLFGLNSGSTLGHLSHNVQEKKRNVSTQAEELAALEARIRETEQRLARAASGPEPSTNTAPQQTAPGAQPPFQPPPRQASAGPPHPTYQSYRGPPFPGQQQQQQQQPLARPPNAREESYTPHIPGAMPRTPTPKFGSGNDYVTVDRTR